MFDFHSHTLASDGGFTARELLLRAQQHQIQHFAITDHDTTAACRVGAEVAHELGIDFYDGVEVSVMHDNKEFHIVGLNLDIENSVLQQALAMNARSRRTRAQSIAEKLPEQHGQNLLSWIAEQSSEQIICRSHIARLLVEQGLEKNANNIFKRWLGRKGRAYRKPTFVSLRDGVAAIKAAGGQAIIAHPLKYDVSKKQLLQLCADFKVAGGQGIEIVYSGQTPGQIDKLTELALEFGFSGSVGSDFHYPTPWNQMGKLRPLPSSITPVWQQF